MMICDLDLEKAAVRGSQDRKEKGNSKAEYNHSGIPRLSLSESTPALEDPATEGKEDLEKEVQCWEGRMNARKTESLKNYRRKYTSKLVKDTKTTNKRS